MRKILFVLVAALAFVACNKDEERLVGCQHIGVTFQENFKQITDKNGYKPHIPYLDVVMGDNLLFTTECCDTYIPIINIYDKEGNEIKYYFKRTDTECNFGIGTIKRVEERSYELQIFPNNEDNYRLMTFDVAPLNDDSYQHSLWGIFLDENPIM